MAKSVLCPEKVIEERVLLFLNGSALLILVVPMQMSQILFQCSLGMTLGGGVGLLFYGALFCSGSVEMFKKTVDLLQDDAEALVSGSSAGQRYL